MKAVRAAGDGVVVDDVDEPPGLGELLDMQATSVCASDLMYIRFGLRKILGHELAGVREDGTPVVVEAIYGCMECEQCRSGAYNLCPTHAERALGVSVDGGMAEQFRAPSARLIELPDGLDVRDAPIVEPGAVSWHGAAAGRHRAREARRRGRRRRARPVRGRRSAPPRRRGRRARGATSAPARGGRASRRSHRHGRAVRRGGRGGRHDREPRPRGRPRRTARHGRRPGRPPRHRRGQLDADVPPRGEPAPVARLLRARRQHRDGRRRRRCSPRTRRSHGRSSPTGSRSKTRRKRSASRPTGPRARSAW